ncbi:DUF3800 domain-containing protein [Candidatus Symbiobacter mobilis]|uniref:DUF3800 domain-containing protein n=1 Tax=Candidatus Symbiobacter mobilis CR TaxID=946483 RepID=U5NAT3_9BURK|nr:DUF3800 domain-containing protein [Candidatus Symbiobacter mobilis]AGX87309.1 hypothetical protein Cenrod_1217 [Candidatus Symbiobacter mobilis CR]
MYVCYIDEAGCTGELTGPGSAVQPAFVLNGLIVPAGRIESLTRAWIQLKQTYFPKRLPQESNIHDWMVAEIKGSDIRRMARADARNERRFAHQVVGSALDLLERHGTHIVGRVFVKPIPGAFDGTAVYTSSVQSVCRSFQTFLEQNDDIGIVIADSRNKGKNTNVAHSVFTQRYAAAGDPYSRIIEIPTFGHSDNHAGLQLADLICSTLLFPIAVQRCASHVLTDHTHCSPHYERLPDKFGERLQALQYRYRDGNSYWHGGISLTDKVSQQHATILFSRTP